MREYDQAIEQAEFTSALAPPSFNGVHGLLARIYWLQDRITEAIAEEKKNAELSANPAPLLSDLDQVGRIYERSGSLAARSKVAQMKEQECGHPANGHGPAPESCEPGIVANWYGLVGERDKALFWLNRYFAVSPQPIDWQCWLPNSLETAPEFDFLRSDPRFRDLVHRMGLPE